MRRPQATGLPHLANSSANFGLSTPAPARLTPFEPTNGPSKSSFREGRLHIHTEDFYTGTCTQPNTKMYLAAVSSGGGVTINAGPRLPGQDQITFVGAAWIGGWCDVWQDMSKSMAIFDASGNVLGSVTHEEPQTATADNGLIGKSGTIYDQNGNVMGQGNFLASTIICILAGSLCSCHRQPDLVPRLIIEGEPVGRDFYLSAPYMAVVKIINAAPIARRAIFEGGPKDLVLEKYGAIVENTIRGKFPTPSISFYFFGNLGQKHDYHLHPGQRYIVSLRTDGGVFRSWSDAMQLKIEVSSGSHNQQDLPLGLGPKATIAYILLTPGTDLDVREFEVGILNAREESRASPKYAYERLMNLQKHADPRVRGAACFAGAFFFGDLPKCLTADNPDPSVRERLRGQLTQDQGPLLNTLQKTPSALLPKRWDEYFLEMLEIYTDDVRPAVRAAACADLRNIAPERKVANCP